MRTATAIGDNTEMTIEASVHSSVVRFSYADDSASVILLDPTYAELERMIKALQALKRVTGKSTR